MDTFSDRLSAAVCFRLFRHNADYRRWRCANGSWWKQHRSKSAGDASIRSPGYQSEQRNNSWQAPWTNSQSSSEFDGPECKSEHRAEFLVAKSESQYGPRCESESHSECN